MVKLSSAPADAHLFRSTKERSHCHQRSRDWARQPETLAISDVSFRTRSDMYISVMLHAAEVNS